MGLRSCFFRRDRFCLFIESRIHIVNIFLVHLVLRQPQALAEPLEMDNLPGPKEFNGVADVRVVGEAENVVVGNAGLLLWCDLVRTTFRPLPKVKIASGGET